MGLGQLCKWSNWKVIFNLTFYILSSSFRVKTVLEEQIVQILRPLCLLLAWKTFQSAPFVVAVIFLWRMFSFHFSFFPHLVQFTQLLFRLTVSGNIYSFGQGSSYQLGFTFFFFIS